MNWIVIRLPRLEGGRDDLQFLKVALTVKFRQKLPHAWNSFRSS